MTNEKPLLDIFAKKKTTHVPFWLMRQAGRYLPEYRMLREKARSFMGLAYDPENASEVTLQPIRRYGMDGAILFSDILVIPDALGQKVTFEAGEGPKLEPLGDVKLENIEKHLLPVFTAIKKVREKLEVEKFHSTTLIGFCGAPWTVCAYMIEGGSSVSFQKATGMAKENPKELQKIIDVVAEASIIYLEAQIKAGVEVVQIFESWAGLLDGKDFDQWVIKPTKKIITRLKHAYPDVPVIGFPRGCGINLDRYIQETSVDGVGIDQSFDMGEVAVKIDKKVILQGNLDPLLLLEGGTKMKDSIIKIHENMNGRPYVFNLGHGVIKETPPENVSLLKEIVRGLKP